MPIHDADLPVNNLSTGCSQAEPDAFAALRVNVSRRYWRVSPRIPGLFLVKRAILFAYSRRRIGVANAQKFIDATRSWEA